MSRVSRTLRYKVLMAVVLCVVIGWSVLWFVAATIVDRQAEKMEHLAASQGATAECADRHVTGFPFRIEVRCQAGTHLGVPGSDVELEGLTVAALVYRPSRIILEAQSPLRFAAAGAPEVAADWDLAHLSTRLDFAKESVERLDVEIVDGSVSAGGALPVTFSEFDLNVRRSPVDPNAMDLAVRAQNLAPQPDVDTASLALRGTLQDGAGLLAGNPQALLGALLTKGAVFDIEAATFESGDMQLAAAGKLNLGADGLLNGTIDMAVAGHDQGVPYMAVLAPQAEQTVSTLLSNILAFAPAATIGDRAAKKISLQIRDGQVRAGILPLFTIPPIRP
ncbi:MAG: DUF2125 domain-containing protein [Pseudomonadota bacterium]